MTQSLAHISLVVRDYDEAIDWFVGKLGFTLVADEPQTEQDKRWVLIAPPGAPAGSTSILLARAASPGQEKFIGNQSGGRVFLFLRTDDFDRDYRAMLAEGIAFARPPKQEPYGTVAVFEDLYGNLWDLVQFAGSEPPAALSQSQPLGGRGDIELAHGASRLAALRGSAAAPAPTSTRKSPVMNPNKALWEKGDFTRIAATMRESGEELVDSLGIAPGLAMLDLGCGDGTTALPAARAGAQVLGIDIAENLVAAGRARAEAAGLSNLRFEQGDASKLIALADRRFDLVLSMFGAMFAPRPFDVAREMVRVTRPGGRIVMGNWIPGDPTLVAQILKISAAYTPPPPEGFVSPVTWGIEDNVRERFAAAGIAPEDIAFERSIWLFRHDGPAAEFLDMFRHYYGPTMNAFDSAAGEGREDALQAELAALFEAQNRAGPDRTEIPATYLKVTVTKG
jgi:SAM-dependent methyltransferase/catechol 2,3-dioxygenase-like lactoylglutathione lyase family enzyme